MFRKCLNQAEIRVLVQRF